MTPPLASSPPPYPAGMDGNSALAGDTRRGRLMRLATFASLAVAAMLSIAKAIAFWLSGSAAMLGSLFDSALDFLASAIIFLGVRVALVPPDSDHRFGHGKAEGIASLVQALLMTASSLYLMVDSIGEMLAPHPITHDAWIIGVSAGAMLLSGALVLFQRWVIARTGSLAIDADRLHYAGDLLLNLSVIASALLVRFLDAPWIDGLFGLLIAGWIARAAVGIGREAVDVLMDREFPDAAREKIFEVAMGNPAVKGVHEIKTRSSGSHDFIQLHLEVDPELTVRAAHLVATEVEAALSEDFPQAEIIIHVDPFGLEPHEPVVGPPGSGAVLEVGREEEGNAPAGR